MSVHESFGSGTFKTNPALKPNDVILTPEPIAKEMIALYDIPEGAKVLDPCSGEGVFYDNYPAHCEKDWCEISKGRDFFAYTDSVDWIISNPPYSIFEEFLTHSLKIADNVCFLVPLAKVVSSLRRINKVLDYGGFVSMHIIGASRCGFPFGFPAAAIHMKRGYKGDTEIKMWGE